MIGMALVLVLAQQPVELLQLTNLPVHGRRSDTVVNDFNGDGMWDLLTVSVDFDADPPVRWLALHLQDRGKGFSAKPDFLWPVHPTAAALAFGNFVPEGGMEIATIAPDGVYYYPFEGGRIVEEPRKLIHVRTFFDAPSNRALPIWMYPQDLSADGRDDLVLPTPDGYRVYFQTEPGRFGKISRLETGARAPRRFPESLEYASKALFELQTQLPRVTAADVDGNGLQDLVTVEGDVVRYFFQIEPNEYRAQKARGWMTEYKVPPLQQEERKDGIGYLQVDFRDIDGDRLPDLVVTKIQGEVGLFESLKTRIDICFGATGRGNYDSNLFISISGVSIDPAFIDMNGDGKLDCLTSRLRTDLVNQALSLGILGDVSIDYEVFQFDPSESRYLESPVYSYPVHVRLDDIQKKMAASRPLLFVPGDLNGDGRPDQVRFNPVTDMMEMHPGRTRAGVIDFDGTPHMDLKLERYPRDVQFHDLNGDGLTDTLMLHHGSVDVVMTRKR